MSATPNNWFIATCIALLSISVEAGLFAAASSMAKAHAANAAQAGVPPPISTHRNEADTSHTVPTDYICEFGVNFTTYKIDSDDSHMFVRWESGMHRLERVMTTTGAQRFENEASGLTWIAIPTKVVLLDSKLHRQLANECKTAEIIDHEPDADEDGAPLAPIPPSRPD
jgi:hypothetical protein